MTDTKSDNLTGDLLRIHAAITRGIDIVLKSKGKKGAQLNEESLYVTLIAHHKTKDERRIFAKNLPPEVLKMVDTEWKEKWEPMRSLFYGI